MNNKFEEQASRTKSDAELIVGGAEYGETNKGEVKDNPNLRLEVAEDQIEKAREEMKVELSKKERIDVVEAEARDIERIKDGMLQLESELVNHIQRARNTKISKEAWGNVLNADTLACTLANQRLEELENEKKRILGEMKSELTK